MRIGATHLTILFLLGAGHARASVRIVDGDPVSVTTRVESDSVTVGERFRVVHTFSFPDSLRMIPFAATSSSDLRVVANDASERAESGRTTRTITLTMLTLNLDRADVPEMAANFVAPSSDTLRAFTHEIALGVRKLSADSKDLMPLREQWEAPRPWITWALWTLAGLLALAAVVWWVRARRRRRRAEDLPTEVRLPADYVALTELTRIEQMGLLDRAEYKHYYSLVIDVLRRYIEARYGVEAMDRTSIELLGDLKSRGTEIDHLGALLNEADLVKFAKVVPPRASAESAIRSAREIIVATTPRHVAEAPVSKAHEG